MFALLSNWLGASLGGGEITLSRCSLAAFSVGKGTCSDSSASLPLERRCKAGWVQEKERCRGAGCGDRK